MEASRDGLAMDLLELPQGSPFTEKVVPVAPTHYPPKRESGGMALAGKPENASLNIQINA